MTIASDNPFPSVLIVETEAVDLTANPATGQRRLIVDPSDHLLYLVDDAGTPTLVGGGAGDITTDAAWAAKGNLIAGTANDAASILSVGANDTILMADSGQSTGLKWVASQTPSTQAFSDAAAEGTADTYARGDHKHAMPANPGGGGALVWLARQTASASATLDFFPFISSTYETYRFVFNNIIPATDAALFYMRMGTGGTPTYDAGTNYSWAAIRWLSTTSGVQGANSGANQIQVLLGMDTASALWSGNGHLELHNPASAIYKHINGQFFFLDNATTVGTGTLLGGSYNSTTAVTAVRFLMSTGNIASGTIDMYGITKA